MDYKNLLTELLVAKQSAERQGLSGMEFTKGLGALVPELLDRLQGRATSEEGRDALDHVLRRHEDDDFNDANDYVERLDNSEKDAMVDSILGQNRRDVEHQAAEKSGLDESTIKKILLVIAPLVLISLSKNKKEKRFGRDDLPREVDELRGTVRGDGLFGQVKNLLDKDGDGHILDDLF
ncbi:DUF937 domain-containing protein [Peptoniphilus equinus]|uniref:DUF937 domain-containing protein n=1 Tax=Peptoniphilus equinus TaxID=3016343 RepID=A0ABY7QU24_9FIRM|nr:DUF937 domain-containing protein [Peptoniphilus equinus]WBW50283.1 DUF937 domain-containing protein [Peptoniphilus equinus]